MCSEKVDCRKPGVIICATENTYYNAIINNCKPGGYCKTTIFYSYRSYMRIVKKWQFSLRKSIKYIKEGASN